MVTDLRAAQDRIVKRHKDCKQLYVDSLQEQVNHIVFQPECGGEIEFEAVSHIWSLDDRKCLNFQKVVKLEQDLPLLAVVAEISNYWSFPFSLD